VGPGIKGLSITEGPDGRWFFLYDDAKQVQNAIASVKSPFDKERLEAMLSKTTHLEAAYYVRSNGSMYFKSVETTLSSDEQGFMNLQGYGILYPDAMKNFKGLRGVLWAMAKSKEAKEEAGRIAKAIQNTWNYNWRFDWHGRGDQIKGYLCQPWAFAFIDAFKFEASSKYFNAWIDAKGMPNEEAGHAWLVITSPETGMSIFIDDGFKNANETHLKPPNPPSYTERRAPDDDVRKNDPMPDAYDAKGKNRTNPPPPPPPLPPAPPIMWWP
jgi:hypothetical protein